MTFLTALWQAGKCMVHMIPYVGQMNSSFQSWRIATTRLEMILLMYDKIMELATIASRTRPLNNFLWAFLQVELVCFSFPDAGKVLTQDHFKMLNAFSVISRVLRSCSNRMGFIHLQLTSTFVLSPPAHNYYMVMVKTCLILKDSLIQLSLM